MHASPCRAGKPGADASPVAPASGRPKLPPDPNLVREQVDARIGAVAFHAAAIRSNVVLEERNHSRTILRYDLLRLAIELLARLRIEFPLRGQQQSVNLRVRVIVVIERAALVARGEIRRDAGVGSRPRKPVVDVERPLFPNRI